MAKMLRQTAERLLADTPERHVFWCHNGRKLKNMKELAEELAKMTDNTFAFHSNREKNDFSKWVNDIIQDKKLSNDLTKASGRTQAATLVADRIAYLNSRLV